MSSLIRTVFQILVIGSAVIFAVKTTKAQDPVQVDPDHYKVLYENDNVRVLRYDDEPGHFVPKHSHPHYAVYVLAPARRLFLTGNCASAIATKPINLMPGPPFLKPPVTHCERNAGKTDTHLIIVEFKPVAKRARAAHARKRRSHKLSGRARRQDASQIPF